MNLVLDCSDKSGEKSIELNGIRSSAERTVTFALQCMSFAIVEASVLSLLVSPSH